MSDEPIGKSCDQPAIALRPERPDDDPFLFQVYASTREAELAQTGWDTAMRTAFLQMQFKAMSQGYRGSYPQGEFNIIELAGQPVGRQVVNRARTEILLVDVALLPAYRGRGIGSTLLQILLAEAAGAATPVRLHVLKDSRARSLYQRMGFECIGGDGLYEEWEWSPAKVVARGAGCQ